MDGNFTLRELEIIERAILNLQNVELNQGFEELKKLFPETFRTPETYWELKALSEKIIREKHKTPEYQLKQIQLKRSQSNEAGC